MAGIVDGSSLVAALDKPLSLESAEQKLAELLKLTSVSGGSKQELEGLARGIVDHVNSCEISAQEKGRASFIRGAALNTLSSYNAEAEELLSKAVKLDPLNIEAWNALGECFWKKGDLESARHCFDGSLAQRENASALRNLSMVLRQVEGTPQEKVRLMGESVAKAKAAVAFDVTDPESWYVLGNTYLALFFAMSHELSDLASALKAYKRSDSLSQNGMRNPDLYYNRAQVHVYREDFNSALLDFREAARLDPQLPAGERIEELERRIRRTAELVTRKGKIKPKRLAAVEASFSADPPPGATLAAAESGGKNRTLATLAKLREGENEGIAVKVRMLMPLVRSRDPPVSFLVVDGESTSAALSVYNLDDSVHDKLRPERDCFTVLDPVVKHVEYTDHTGTTHRYKLVQAKGPQYFFVNGSQLKKHFAHAALATSSFTGAA